MDGKGEEWSSYPCLASNDNNSSNLTLFDFLTCLPKEYECYAPADSFEIFFYGNDCATVIYDNPNYFDNSYDNPLFVPNIEIHCNKEFFLEIFYDKDLDDGPMLLDNIKCTTIENWIG